MLTNVRSDSVHRPSIKGTVRRTALAWLDTIKDHYDDPFARINLKWLRDNQAVLYEKLKEDFRVQSRIERSAAVFAELFGEDDEV